MTCKIRFAILGFLLPISFSASSISAQTNPVNSTTTGTALGDADILDGVKVDFFTATPSSLHPFDPTPAILKWRTQRPSVAGAGAIHFNINGTPFPSQGTLPVRPTQTQAYHLIATLRAASRELGVVTVQLDTGKCATLSYQQEFLNGLVSSMLQAAIPQNYQNRIYNVTSVLTIDPAAVHLRIRAKIHFDLEGGGVNISEWPDPDLNIDIAFRLSAARGRVILTYDQFDVNIDADWLLDAALFFLDPNFKRNIENEIYFELSRALSDQVTAIINSEIPNGSRLWSLRFFVQGNTRSVDQVNCPYLLPWEVTVTLLTVRLEDTSDVGRPARLTLNIRVNGERTTYPIGAPADLYVNASGQTETRALPRQLTFTSNVGILDPIYMDIVAHDGDKTPFSTCSPRIIGSCTTPSLPELARSFDWTNNFSRGSHTEQSTSLDGESFVLQYRVDVRANCPTCLGQPLPSE